MPKPSPSTDLCICKICCCGRHHCPHQPMRTVATGPCSLSEYTNEYINRPLEQVQSCKPLSVYTRNPVPLDDKTNHRIDYVPHPLEKKYVHQREPYRPTDVEFEKNTTYTTEYNAKQGERAQMIIRQPQAKDLAKFEGTPTYKSDYPGWNATPREVYGKPSEWVPPTVAFGGIPTYSLDYVKYQNTRPAESFRPQQETEIANVPFQDMTENRQSYTTHPLDVKRVKEQREWSRPAVPFTGESTFTSDYREKPLGINKSCKPPANTKLSTEPLQNETTHNTDYKPWGIEKPFVHHYEKYNPPEGNMMTDTTYIRDYLPRTIDRVMAFKPKHQRENLGLFNGKTSYSDDFQKWNVTSRQQYGPNRDYIPSDIPFENKTTHGTHFVPMPFSVRESFKQTGQTQLSNAPFHSDTLYRTEFTAKDVPICPTLIMGSPKAPFEFTGEINNHGHRLVAPRKNAEPKSLTEVAVY